jgi:hypothetical protein
MCPASLLLALPAAVKYRRRRAFKKRIHDIGRWMEWNFPSHK